jgi:hypothetical protein
LGGSSGCATHRLPHNKEVANQSTAKMRTRLRLGAATLLSATAIAAAVYRAAFFEDHADSPASRRAAAPGIARRFAFETLPLEKL